MPATAGRVRMPANNRVHSSAALQTHGIWQSAIGYDPYAPNKEEKKDKSAQPSAAAEPEPENAYASFQGLLALARITGSNADEARGSCKKCGRVGHLTFQCRNFLSAKDEADKDADAIQAAILSGLEKLKGDRLKVNGKNASESEESSEEESESSDSDYDSEMERIIAQKYGKNISGRKLSSKNRKKYDSDESEDDGFESKAKEKRKRERKERGRSKKRSSKRGNSESEDEDEDEDEGRRKRRKEKRRRRDDDSSNEDEERRQRRRKTRKEKHRRSSHLDSEDDSSDDSGDQRNKRRNRRAASVSDSDDSRVGRHKKRSDKKRRHRHSSP